MKLIVIIFLTLLSFLPPLVLLLGCVMIAKTIGISEWLASIVGSFWSVTAWYLFLKKDTVAMWRSIGKR